MYICIYVDPHDIAIEAVAGETSSPPDPKLVASTQGSYNLGFHGSKLVIRLGLQATVSSQEDYCLWGSNVASSEHGLFYHRDLQNGPDQLLVSSTLLLNQLTTSRRNSSTISVTKVRTPMPGT